MLEFDKGIIDRLEADGTSIPDDTLIGERELTKGEWEDFPPPLVRMANPSPFHPTGAVTGIYGVWNSMEKT